MDLERLKKITMEIVKLNDPLAVFEYIGSLSNNDIKLLFEYVQGSEYKEMNLYTGVLSFSHDYLRSVNSAMPNSIDTEQESKDASKRK